MEKARLGGIRGHLDKVRLQQKPQVTKTALHLAPVPVDLALLLVLERLVNGHQVSELHLGVWILIASCSACLSLFLRIGAVYVLELERSVVVHH